MPVKRFSLLIPLNNGATSLSDKEVKKIKDKALKNGLPINRYAALLLKEGLKKDLNIER